MPRSPDPDREPDEERRPCIELSAGEARYLLAISDLARSGTQPSQAALARRLGVAPPTALQMIRRLRQLGLLAPGSMRLTATGTSAALVLTARRRAAHVLAHDVLGLDEEEAEAEAERLASSVSPKLGRRLVAWRAADRSPRRPPA